MVRTDAAADPARMPEAGREVGTDLGLGHFAALSDGRKVDSPRFLRRAEKRLKKAQRAPFRKKRDRGTGTPRGSASHGHTPVYGRVP